MRRGPLPATERGPACYCEALAFLAEANATVGKLAVSSGAAGEEGGALSGGHMGVRGCKSFLCKDWISAFENGRGEENVSNLIPLLKFL